MTEVVAALICKEGRFLICQRPTHKARGSLWEFVGGKRERGESREEALIRECQEELAVEIEVHDVFMDLTHVYPDITIRLILYKARIAQGEPKNLEHQDIRWIQTEEIPNYSFCPADEMILKRLAEDGLQG